MKKKLFKNIIMYITILTLTSCSKPVDKNLQEVNKNNIKETINKGGYIEEVLKLPLDVAYIRDVKQVSSGEIILVTDDNSFNEKIYISSDCGEEWNELDVKRSKLPIDNENNLFTNVLSNGKIITSFTDQKSNNEVDVQYFVTNEDFEFESINLVLNQESKALGNMPVQFVELNNGDLVSRVNSDTLIQLDKENYTEKYRYKVDSYINGYSNVDDLLIITLEDEMISYNINNGEIQSKQIEFIESVKSIPGEKNIISAPTKDYLYYCNNSKLFGYSIQNNKSEEIIADAKYISNTSLYINNFIKINETDYMFVMNVVNEDTGNLVRYRYIDNIEEVENEEVTIYSLLENKELQSLITQLNMNNSNISVDYEVGITEGTGANISDAIKVLNTEIMAGKGPDIIILDNLPVYSYIENGVLTDIKDIVVGDENNIFTTISKSFEEDGAIYQFPLSISLPAFVGNKDLLNKVNDLNSLLDIVEQSSMESDNRIFEYLGTPEEFIYSFYFIFENNWIDKNNRINSKELNNFLEICEEIYTISKEKDDIYQEQRYEELMKQMQINGSSQSEDNGGSFVTLKDKGLYLQSIDVNGMLYKKNKPLFAYGSINSVYQFESLYNLMLKESDMNYKILQNNNKDIFYVTSKVGINSKSENIDIAKKVLENLINSNMYSGTLTPNKERFIKELTSGFNTEDYKYNDDNKHYLKAIENDIDEDGILIETPIYFLNDDDINDIVTRLNKLDSERKTNIVLITEVAKQFTEVIENGLEVKEATKRIIDNIEIYLSE